MTRSRSEEMHARFSPPFGVGPVLSAGLTLVVASLCASCATNRDGGCGGAAAGAPGPNVGVEARLTEIEKRLDYLTSEMAAQRGDIEALQEKTGGRQEGVGK